MAGGSSKTSRRRRFSLRRKRHAPKRFWRRCWGRRQVSAGKKKPLERVEWLFYSADRLLGNLQLARFRIDVAHFFVLEWRVHLTVAEAGLVALVDRAQGPDFRMVGADFGDVQEVDLRFGAVVDQQAAGIAQVRRAQDRQHQVGAARHAVEAQGLAEVFALAR